MLTKKQLDLLDFIHKRVQRDGVPPSFEEMKEAADLRSKSGIHRLIVALEERGFIRRLAHRARAIEIVKLPEALGGAPATAASGQIPETSGSDESAALSGVVEVPIMGKIAAGVPIEAISHAASHLAVPGQMLKSGAGHYALEVKGDSMVEAGINSGDVVVIRETGAADNGDIVVALVEEHEATLKRFFRKGNSVALEAANPAYETRIFPEDKVRVQGRLVGLIRSY